MNHYRGPDLHRPGDRLSGKRRHQCGLPHHGYRPGLRLAGGRRLRGLLKYLPGTRRAPTGVWAMPSRSSASSVFSSSWCWSSSETAFFPAFGATENNLPYAVEYYSFIVPGIPFYMFANGLSSIIRADGNPKFAMLSTLAGAVINVILDPIAIFVLGWVEHHPAVLCPEEHQHISAGSGTPVSVHGPLPAAGLYHECPSGADPAPVPWHHRAAVLRTDRRCGVLRRRRADHGAGSEV